MSTIIKGETFYYVDEVAKEVGVSRGTIVRLLKTHKIQNLTDEDVRRDYKGWRIFNQNDIEKFRAFISTTTP